MLGMGLAIPLGIEYMCHCSKKDNTHGLWMGLQCRACQETEYVPMASDQGHATNDLNVFMRAAWEFQSLDLKLTVIA